MSRAGIQFGLVGVLLLVAAAALVLASRQGPGLPGTTLVERAPGAGKPPSFDGIPGAAAAPVPAPPVSLDRATPAPEPRSVAPGATPALTVTPAAGQRADTIAGTVTDTAANVPMTGFDVWLWDADRVEALGSVNNVRPVSTRNAVDPGSFRFFGLDPGRRYFAGASALGFLSDVRGPVSPSADGGSLPLELHTPGHLVVTVLDDQRRPVPGASVRCSVVSRPWPLLYDGWVNSPHERNESMPSGGGPLLLRNLAPGEFWVAAGYGDLVSLAHRVQVSDAETSDVELIVEPLEGLGDLHVHVIDTSGKSVDDARVTAIRLLGGLPPGHPKWIDEDGIHRGHIENLPAGLWLVSVRHGRVPALIDSATVGIQPGLTTECTIRVGTRP